MATFARRLGTLFYAVSPNETTFQDPKDVPHYESEGLPVIVIFIITELFLKTLLKRPLRLNEFVTSSLVGCIHEATVSLSEGAILLGYEWLYQFRLFEFPWDSPYTWLATFFLVDFCYYWVHRANHEVNLLWLAHQVHHSSEDYTLPTAVRVSFLQRVTYFGFYHPLALLGIPISSVLVHLAFNFLFQFWVHNDFIGKLGPLEWIFNSPSHHRVHHGANKWCLDKNYGSVFIIWDRIFGTYAEERDDEQIVYGLVDQPQTMNGVWHEFYYFGKIYEKAKSMSTWGDSLKAIFYGPGWFPGTPRLGDPDTFPDVKAPRKKYDPQVPIWVLTYASAHVFMITGVQQATMVYSKMTSTLTFVSVIAFTFLTTGSIGSIFDSWRWAPMLEAARCSIYLLYARNTPITNNPLVDTGLFILYAMSAILWTLESMKTIRAAGKVMKVE